MTLESYQPGSYTQALYTGDFPTLANEDELDRMVELYRRDAGSRLPPGEPPPPAALSSTPSPVVEPATSEPAEPTPVATEDTGDYGGGGDINFGGRGPRVKPVEPPPEYPEGDWKATAPPPRHGGRWIGEQVAHTPAPVEAEDPSTWQEIEGGVARGVTGIGKNLGHVAGYVSKQLGKLTDSEVLQQFGTSVDTYVDGLDQQARGIVPERTMAQAWEKGYGAFANWTLGKTLEGGVGMLPPLAIARYAGLPAVLAYGATVSAVEEARREGSTNASVLAAAGEGAVMMGLPLKVMKMTEGQALLKRIATQAMAFAGIGAADPFVKAAVPAVAGEGYKTPTAGQVGEGAYLGGVLGAAMAPTTPGPRAVAAREAQARAAAGARARASAVKGDEQYGPLPEEQGPQLPPRPYPPPPEEQGPELPPRPYQPRDDYGPDLPPRPYPPRPEESFATSDDPAFQGGPKGSPETAPPTVSGDPAATAAIDAAVNPPRTEAPTEEFRPPPFEDPLAAMRSNHEAWVEQQKQRGAQADAVPNQYETPAEKAGVILNPEQQRTGMVGARSETTTDVTQPAPTDALRAAEAAGYKLEPDHLDPNRQVAKNPAGEVIGKGGTAEETIADAVQRKGAPYVDEAPPVQPTAAPEILAKPTAAPIEEATSAKSITEEERAAAPVREQSANEPAAPVLRKAQPAAAEEAIATSKAQAEEPAKPTPTTVVKRPTKRVEVQVGKRGEAAVAEDTPAQTATAEEVQQRRLAEQRRMAEPAAEGKPKRVSLMAEEAGRDIKDAQEKPATSKVTRGTPIDEVGEGMQIEHTAESIAETRSKTTTDKNLRYNDLLHDVLQGNKTLDEASEAAGSKEAGTRGRPRRNKDLADYLDNEVIPRAEKHEAGDRALVDQARRVLENKKTSQAKKDEQLKKLNDQLDARVKARGRQEDERAKLAKIKEHRDQLRGKEEGVDAPLYRDPYVERGIKAAKRLLNLSINRKLQDRIERSEKTGTMDSVHDYLNEIINNHGAKIAAPDMVEYARHLLRLIPDHVQIGSYKALFERHGMSREEAAAAAAEKQKDAAGTYYPDASGIGLHPGAKGHLENTLHEVTHGVTYDYLDHLYRKQQRGEKLTEREQKHVDALDAILKETTRLRDEAAISEREYNELDYAVRAAIGEQTGSERTVGGRHELVSQIMSNPYVREVLGRTETSPEFKAAMKKLGYGEPANLWQAFKAFVKDIVGFKKGSVLDKVLDPLTDILETSSAHRNALDMGVELNAPLRGSGDRRGPPTDALSSQWARDKLRPFGEAVLDARLFDTVRDKVTGSGHGAATWGSRGALISSPTYKIAEHNERVLPAAGEVVLARARANRVASEYRNRWGNDIQRWVRQLRYGDDVASLMNDVSLGGNKAAYLTAEPGLFAQRNAHLSPDQFTRAEALNEKFKQLTPEKQKLYSDLRNHYRGTYDEQRRLEYEDIVRRALPDATQKQIEALGNQVSTRRGIRELIDNPQSVSPEAAALSEAFGERYENSRGLLREIAKFQDAGFVEGDYFPLRRYGDYVLRYGEYGTPSYGVEMFERSNEAKTRREELVKEFAEKAKKDKAYENIHITDVINARAKPNRREFMPESALVDIQREMKRRGASEEEIEQASDAYAFAMARRSVASQQSMSRARRQGVQGASGDAARNLINHYNSQASLFGHLTHGAAEAEGLRRAEQQADAIERATGTAGTAAEIARSKTQLAALETRFANKDPAVGKADLDHARQQHTWLEKPPSSIEAMSARETLNELKARTGPVDSDSATTKTSRVATGLSALYHLIRPAHLALNVAEAHGNAQSFLGAAYGQGRAAAAIVKTMKDLGPTGLSRGFKNAVKATMGEMQHSDWHTGDMLLQKLISLKPGDAAHEAEMRGLMDHANDYGAVDHTLSREVQRLSRSGGFDFGSPTSWAANLPRWTNVPSNMMNLFAVGEHTVDSTMRTVIIKAAYDLARSRGADVETATRDAVRHAMDAIPVYGSWNTPRIATTRAPILKELVPAAMQYKLYGMSMYATMGGLVRKAAFRPEERGEALKALAGLVASHSLLGGVTKNLFSLPVVAALGAWSFFSGDEKPHDYEVDFKRWVYDTTGSENVARFVSSGAFGMAGADQANSLGLGNMVGVPEVRTFDKAGAGQFMIQGLTGASGDVASQIFEGLHELTSGNWGRAIKTLTPRVISDPVKAYDLATEGVVDKRGRSIAPPVSTGQAALQALGFNPYEASIARQRRHAEESYQDEYQLPRRRAIDRYVLSGGKDMTGVRSYMNNKDLREASPIKYQQLREALKEEQKRERRPEFYGARPTKREERPFREATRFY